MILINLYNNFFYVHLILFTFNWFIFNKFNINKLLYLLKLHLEMLFFYHNIVEFKPKPEIIIIGIYS